jgi:hypothetical protein
LVHVVRGLDPSTGRRPPAIGIIAIGQVAMGVVAIGQLAVGGIAIGQAAIGLLGGLGQLAVGVVAAGQLAAGAVAAIGHLGLGPRSIGVIEHAGPWAPLLWMVAGFLMAAYVLRRTRILAPLLRLRRRRASAGQRAADTHIGTPISALRDGAALTAGRVVSENQLRAPLSNRPCVYWQSLRIGPGEQMNERGGNDIVIDDGTGSAHLELDGAVTFIRNDTYTELPAPDWSLYMETYLAKGDEIYVAGPVRLEPHVDTQQGLYRTGGVSPVFRGQPDAPVLVTTQPPFQLKAELKLGFGLAAALMVASMVAVGQLAALCMVGVAACAVSRGWLSPR